jgi:acetyltransferase-like isoleucine patch superfamily enzyme
MTWSRDALLRGFESVVGWLFTAYLSARYPGNTLYFRGIVTRWPVIRIRGRDNTITVGPGFRGKRLEVEVRGDGNVLQVSNLRSRSRVSFWLDEGSTLQVGPGSTIEEAAIAATEATKVAIGSDAMLATGVDIRSGDSHSIILESGQRTNYASDVFIGDHVWVCAKVTILKGSSVGQNSVIATGSLVAGSSFEAGSLIAGCPARLRRQGVNWLRARI